MALDVPVQVQPVFDPGPVQVGQVALVQG
jgi:hypothetical protein